MLLKEKIDLLTLLFSKPDDFIKDRIIDSTMEEMLLGAFPQIEFTSLKSESGRKELVDKIDKDYLYLFVGVSAPLASPYESSYYRKDSRLMDVPAKKHIKIMKKWGLELSEDYKDLPDHITSKLSIISVLLDHKEKVGEEILIKEIEKDLASITSNLDWIKQFRSKIEENEEVEFYSKLALALEDSLREIKFRRLGTAIILAGGKSTRMGFDKQLIEIDGKLIVDHIADKLKKYFEQIIVVTNSPELYEAKEYDFVQDLYKGLGPLAGIHVGLLNAKSDGAYVIACDMPTINGEFVEYLKEVFEKNRDIDGIVSSQSGFLEPLNAVYSKELLGEIASNLENNTLKLRSIIEKNKFYKIPEEKIISFDKELKMFRNINYKEDIERLKKEGI